jgi:type VI protein secretion system component Hcp
MKLALLTTIFSVLSLASAAAQTTGEIVISGASTKNCLPISNSNLNGFNALTWSLGGADAVSFGSNGTAGRVALADLVLTRNVDVCSEGLIKNFLVGQSFPTLTLTQYEGGGGATPAYAYMVVTLSNAVVNNYSVGGSNSTDPGETVSFGYSKLCVQTTGLNNNGTLKPPVSVCYNLATNTVQ